MPRRTSPDTEGRLTPTDWEDAALEALADSGLRGVAIEPLARRLGVTKGSFYWHFTDREALLAAALKRWEINHTDRLIRDLEELPDARKRLVRLINQVSAGGQSDRIHLALASEPNELVRETLARVTERRLAFLESCYAELGQSSREASQSALLAYAAYIGLLHLRVEAPRALPTSGDFSAYVEHLGRRLVPSAPKARRRDTRGA